MVLKSSSSKRTASHTRCGDIFWLKRVWGAGSSSLSDFLLPVTVPVIDRCSFCVRARPVRKLALMLLRTARASSSAGRGSRSERHLIFRRSLEG